ncbi:hypothetical protein [Myxococcus landrumensis]|uniref:Uncharacterized protein n=1 Tax=Myxococcus landrumensis TaxID=2813577 RepID=A0ABX7NI45_9BACT|nr:hypothetical protein [Myxococcus landrumus]QSQ17164.1 hypothetical protein JY572_14355 [Myxococcus landrumus]
MRRLNPDEWPKLRECEHGGEHLMLPLLPRTVRILLAREPVDLRKGQVPNPV